MQQTTSALFQLHIKYDEILLAQLKKKSIVQVSVVSKLVCFSTHVSCVIVTLDEWVFLSLQLLVGFH